MISDLYNIGFNNVKTMMPNSFDKEKYVFIIKTCNFI